MEERIENNEMMELKNEDNCESTDSCSNSGRGGAGLLGLGLAVVGGAVYLWKNKEKIKQKRIDKKIAKMESLGYTVTKNEEPSEEVKDINDSDVEETTEE